MRNPAAEYLKGTEQGGKEGTRNRYMSPLCPLFPEGRCEARPAAPQVDVVECRWIARAHLGAKAPIIEADPLSVE